MNKLCTEIYTLLSHKKVLLLGYGREGKSSFNLINKLKIPCIIGIADQRQENEVKGLLPSDTNDNVQIYCGKDYLKSLEQYDLIIKSPGIPLTNELWLKHSHKITSQIELFLKYFSGLTIGITGSKGKSSTSTMIYEILKVAGFNPLLLGNIGVPVLDEAFKLNDNDTTVLELSSHQLHKITASPKISIFLNLYQEHLDYYDSFEDYALAKCNIAKYQSSEGILIASEKLKSRINDLQLSSTVYYFGTSSEQSLAAKVSDSGILLSKSNIHIPEECYKHLPGEHFRLNVMAASLVAEKLDISQNFIQAGLQNFKLLPHRLEQFKDREGRIFINDSGATIPEAAIAAIKAFPDTATLIVGGMDRGVNLDLITKFLSEESDINIIGLPDTGHIIIEKLNSFNYSKRAIHKAKDLKEAVALCKKLTPKDKICLFSPAAASYNEYANYYERGELFKKLVMEVG